MHISCIIYIIKGQKHCFEMLLPFFLFFYSRTQVRQAFRRICNPALKNVLTYLGSADLQSAAKEYAFPFVGGLQIPRF